jgi:uncharacterized beta-barrel protein YwiB (DUF1934 family)
MKKVKISYDLMLVNNNNSMYNVSVMEILFDTHAGGI